MAPNVSPASPDRRRVTIAVAVILVAAVALIGILAVLTKGFGLLGASTASTSASVATASSVDAVASDSSAATTSSSAVTVRTSLADYSWDDLSKISKDLEACGSRAKALELAKTYNLVTSNNKITTSTKPVKLTDGTTVDVRIADIYHDALSSGAGTAGLTFICTSSVASRQMESSDTNVGGWSSSEMRSWLASTEAKNLPSELSSAIVSVKKSTDNTGQTTSVSSVTKTDDKLWLLSVAEVVGSPSWDWDSDPTNSSSYNAILGAEGTQYACFSDMGLNTSESNASLVMRSSAGTATDWWLRSTSPSVSRHFRSVDASGDPSCFDAANDAHGVVFGFCI
jgi:hypothetical protein